MVPTLKQGEESLAVIVSLVVVTSEDIFIIL